jgi:hypothetical protein
VTNEEDHRPCLKTIRRRTLTAADRTMKEDPAVHPHLSPFVSSRVFFQCRRRVSSTAQSTVFPVVPRRTLMTCGILVDDEREESNRPDDLYLSTKYSLIINDQSDEARLAKQYVITMLVTRRSAY